MQNIFCQERDELVEDSANVELSRVTTRMINGKLVAEAVWAKNGKDFLIDSLENGCCSHVLI